MPQSRSVSPSVVSCPGNFELAHIGIGSRVDMVTRSELVKIVHTEGIIDLTSVVSGLMVIHSRHTVLYISSP